MPVIKPLQNIEAAIAVPADKSISHRALILAALVKGKTLISNYLESADTAATLDCLQKMGVNTKWDKKKRTLTVEGKGLYLPRKTKALINAGESGTTMRILSGVLCGQKFAVKFDAKPALKKRPMRRIVDPLRRMGADIGGIVKKDKVYPPLTIKPVKCLSGGNFRLRIASAQVKSALLLAGLYAKSPVTVYEPQSSRDHTERMLKLFGADLFVKNKTVVCSSRKKLTSPKKITVPGDFSSAAFFIVLGLIAKNSQITLKDVNINHTRTGLLRALLRMGADIKVINKRNAYEPVADLVVRSSTLKGVAVEEEEIAAMIDEVPVLCVAAAFAAGKTAIFGVKELKVKETDRIDSMVKNLSKAGVNIWAGPAKNKKGEDDYMIMVDGMPDPRPAAFKSFGDHRTAMSMIVFAAASGRRHTIDDVRCTAKSFPGFIELIAAL